MSAKLGKPWPGFVPVDPNATCARCGESWQWHGVGENSHCPPCTKDWRHDKSFKQVEKAAKKNNYVDPGTTCQKPMNHKGKCKHA